MVSIRRCKWRRNTTSYLSPLEILNPPDLNPNRILYSSQSPVDVEEEESPFHEMDKQSSPAEIQFVLQSASVMAVL